LIVPAVDTQGSGLDILNRPMSTIIWKWRTNKQQAQSTRFSRPIM
jgi:hypothetical protein